ncbi:hypothetical protein KR059_003820, partial [Drosophila kikkawai]
VKGLRAGSTAPSDPEALDGIVRALFPTGSPVTMEPSAERLPNDACEVSEAEVIQMGNSVPPKKAPGPDAVPNRAFKLSIALYPRAFATLYSKCLEEGTFPERWKRQKLLLLAKPGKPQGEPSSYRPICLTAITGKVFEWIISARLSAAIEEAGVPQGSVLGPLLWNTMYNGVLNLPLSSNTTIVGFADDVALVVVAKELADAETAANSAIRAVESWLAVAGLELASHKTEAVLISSRKRVETAEIRVGGLPITSQRALRYLGVILDTRLCYREHLE